MQTGMLRIIKDLRELLSSSEMLKIKMAPGGGWAARLTKK